MTSELELTKKNIMFAHVEFELRLVYKNYHRDTILDYIDRLPGYHFEYLYKIYSLVNTEYIDRILPQFMLNDIQKLYEYDPIDFDKLANEVYEWFEAKEREKNAD